MAPAVITSDATAPSPVTATALANATPTKPTINPAVGLVILRNNDLERSILTTLLIGTTLGLVAQPGDALKGWITK